MTDDPNREGPLMGHKQDPDDNEYATPGEIWRPLADAVGGFDVDPASGAESVPIADTRFTKADGGLSQAWFGNVFVNPPWSTKGDGSAKHDWLRKCKNEANRETVDVVVVLMPGDTSAHWFHDHILDAEVVCFVGPGRIPFEGENRNPSFKLVIAGFGAVSEALKRALHDLGAVFHGRRIYQPTHQTTLGGDSDG